MLVEILQFEPKWWTDQPSLPSCNQANSFTKNRAKNNTALVDTSSQSSQILRCLAIAPINKALLVHPSTNVLFLFGSRSCWYKTHSTPLVLFSQHPIFTSNPKSVREFDWTQMAGNSSEMTVAKLNHRTWEYLLVADASRPGVTDILSSSSCPAPPPAIDYSLTRLEIYVTSVKQVINLQQLLYIFNGLEAAVGEK